MSDFGEIVTWWSIYALCAPALSAPLAALSISSPLFVTYLLLQVSGIPLLEISSEKRYGDNEDFLKYRRDTPLLFPRLFRLRPTSTSTSTSKELEGKKEM